MEDLGLQNFISALFPLQNIFTFFFPLLNLFRLYLSKLESSKSIYLNFVLTKNAGAIWVANITTVF